MANPVFELVKAAPSIIDAINPLAWFKEAINSSREYKLEKLRLEKDFAMQKEERDFALRELEMKREVFLATLQENRKTIAKLNEPLMHQIAAHSKKLDEIEKHLQQILNSILSADIPSEDRALYYNMYKDLNAQVLNVMDRMQAAIDADGTKLLKSMESLRQGIPTAALRRRLK